MTISKVGADRVLEQAKAAGQKSIQEKHSEKTKEAPKQSMSSKVSWSEDASLLSEGIEAVKNSKDLRQSKVDQLKTAIKNGTYKVDADQVAAKMLQRSLGDDLLTNKS